MPVLWQALQPLVESVLLAHEDILVTNGITPGSDDIHCEAFNPHWKVAPEQPVRRVLEQYLLPLIRTSNNRIAIVDKNPSDGATAVIKAAIALILLYVPDRPYDPSLPAQVQRQFHDAQLESLRNKLDGLIQLAQLTIAQSTSLRSRLVQDEILALGAPPAVTFVARPAQSQLEILQADFTTILNLVQRVAHDVEEDSLTAERASEYLESVLAVLKRLNSGHKAYDDIVRPVIGFVSILKLGLVLMFFPRPTGTSDAQKKVQSVLTHTPFMHEDPITYAQTAPTLELHRDPELVLHDLELLALRASLTNPSQWVNDAQSNLTTFFSILFSVWELQLSKEQRDAAAATSLYEHKGSYDDEEEANEEELRSLFPTYDEADGDKEAVTKEERALNLHSVTPSIARLHMQIFQPVVTEAPSVTRLLHSAANILGKVAGDGSAFERTPVQQFLQAILLKLRQQQEIVAQDGALPKHYNVYTDANIREAQRVIVLVEATSGVVRPILEAWPEHATLHNILSTCDELLAFRHVEPVMKFLTKVEKLHKQVAEWQTVASKEYSASTILDETTDLLISWRQLELSTWARMLELETEKAEVNARSWYFLAYENVVQRTLTLDLTPEKMNEHATDLLASLEAFMSASTLGQYATKLKILASLQAQLVIVANEKQHLSAICSALKNFIYHYNRFVPSIEKTIEDGRKKLEKDIRSTIQLASWRDRNIEALKQSAKKSHSRLFRVIKKYRVLLSQPAGTIVAQGYNASLPDVVTHLEARKIEAVQLAPTAVALIRQDSVLWEGRPERFCDVESTVTLMQRKTTATSNTVDSSEHLVSFIEVLEVSIEQLQKATPAILTEENTANVKHLTARKRKVFADVLKDLRTMGLKSNVSVDVLATQGSTAKVLSSVPIISTETGARAQDLFSRFLDAMPKVRTSHMEHNEDLTQAEVSRCIGYLESLLAILAKQRTSIERTSSWQQHLASQIAQVKNIWSGKGCTAELSPPEVEADLNQVRVYTPWLSVIIRGGISVLQAQAALGQIDLSELCGSLEIHAITFEAYQSELAALPQLPNGLHTETHTDLQSRQRETISALSQDIQDWSVRWPQTGAILAHISKWIISESTSSADHAQDEHESSHQTPVDFVLAHYALLDQVLGSIQDVAGAMHQLPPSAENSNWLLQEDRARQSILAAFHVETISGSLEAALTSVARSAGVHGESHSSLSLVCGSLTMAHPILQQYHDTLSESLGQYLEIHTATCNLAYRLSRSFMRISSQGFCKPAEASEAQEGKTEKLESGTGLGEGEGAEDISKDIGDDEDLDDLAQDPENKKEDGAEIENEDDAVSIQDELEGDAGESKGEKEEDDGKQDDKEKEDDANEEGSVGDGGDGGGQEEGEEGEDMDEDMGDVDDLGPSAVDEKMWDKAGDDSNKEQESKNQAGEIDKDEQAAGKEDQKKEEKQGEKGEQEEGEGQEDNEENDEMSDDGSDNEPAQEDIAMDPHVKEDEGLELPEELKLDGDKGEDLEVEEGMDEDMPDVDGSGEEDEEARPDELDESKPTETDEQDDQAAEQQNIDAEPNPEESVQDEDIDLANQMMDNGEAGDDQDMADQDSQARGGQANQSNADQQEQEATEADARAEEVEDNQQEQSASASAARRQTGEEKSGATDQSRAANAEQAPPEDGGAPQESTDRQTVKKLGDILEKWHRQQKQIQEQSTERQDDRAPQDIDMADADFEHVPDEDAEADTQALGASSKEQARALNEEMAIETEDRAEDKDVETRLQNADEDEISADEDIDMENTDPTAAASADTQAESQPRTFVGDRRNLNEPIDQPSPPLDNENHPSFDLDTLEEDLDTLALLTRAPPSPSDLPIDPAALWNHHESRTLPLSLLLTEHLRLILAPTLATKLRGDFRTGKRLNIKRIIPYIASQYKRDKIWMRRSVPSKRAYQVMLAIDDSSSMAENGSKELAFDTLALVSKALTSLEVGEIGVVGFGEEVQVAHDFGMPLTGDAGAKVLARFGFKQERTNVRRLVEKSIELFRDARLKASGGGGGADLWQLELIISDGICEDHEGIRRLLLQAQEERIMIVFVIVDAAADVSGAVQGKAKAKQGQTQSSIVDLEKVEFVQGAEGVPAKVVRTKYLDTFPFGYYLVVKDVRDLPGVLSTALRQWFAEVAER